MRDLGKKQLLIFLSILAMFVTMFILLLVFKNIIICYILLILLIIGLPWIYFNIVSRRQDKLYLLSKDKYNYLKTKDNVTQYENLYINAYNKNAVGMITNIMKEHDIKCVSNLVFDASAKEKYIRLSFEYQKYKLHFFIYEDKVSYYIKSPIKYEHLEESQKFEKLIEVLSDINSYNSLENYFRFIVKLIENNLLKINEYIQNTNELKINEHTLVSIKDYCKYIKDSNISLIIIGIIFLGMMGGLSFWAITDILNGNNDNQKYLGLIPVVLLDLMALFSLFLGIWNLMYCRKINNDMKNQNVLYIKAKPYKVKFIKSSVGYKYNVSVFSIGIKLYFKTDRKLKLIYAKYTSYPKVSKRKEIYNDILNNELELMYYKKSKIIVSGFEKYNKKIKKKVK